MMYVKRTYRSSMGTRRFVSREIKYRESDLWVGIDRESAQTADFEALQQAVTAGLKEFHALLKEYGSGRREFFTSLGPIAQDPAAAVALQRMLRCAARAGTGPMACVAGAAAEAAARIITETVSLQELVVENGGDIYLQVREETVLSVFAGPSPLSGKIQVHIPPGTGTVGVCTSSATVGHSMSFGKADAVMVAAEDILLADACATALCNQVSVPADVDRVVEIMRGDREILSGVVILGDRAGLCGDWQITFAK